MNFFSRVLGKAILSDHYQIQNVPKRNSNYCKSSISEGSGSLGRSIGIPSASSVASDISVLSLGSETLKNEVSELKWAKEYMYLLDIFYMDPKRQTRIH